MRKLKLQTQVSIDGFMATPEGKLDWLTWDWDDGLKKYVNELTEPVDCILLGRNIAGGFIDAWASRVKNSEDPDIWFSRKMVETQKIVFTKTLQNAEWENTKLANGDIVEEVNQLKKQTGQDIIAYGGANFVSSLITNGLIDEYNLFINPTAIGKGMTIFSNLKEKFNLKLVQSRAFGCGIVMNKYVPFII